MKGLILGAGNGSRLQPFSQLKPKVLLPVMNRPMIGYCIDKLAELELKEIGIVIQSRHEKLFRDEIGTGRRWGVSITYIFQDQLLGVADAVKQASSFIGDDSFLLLLGDNLIEQPLTALRDAVVRDGHNASILLGPVASPQEYGIAEVVNHRIVSLEEKPLHPKSNLAIVGAYAFGPTVFRAIDTLSPSVRGEFEITDAIGAMIRLGDSVSYCITTQKHLDMGRHERWLEANRWMLKLSQEARRKAAMAKYKGCTFIEPVAIAENCKLEGCIIGPNVTVGPNVELTQCLIANSIVLEGTHLTMSSHSSSIISPIATFSLRNGGGSDWTS
ncbi:sugar phosphate nucleotidyltransferase [Cohnella faecalis]|uniref:Glucose-1-phosphate thymidylyltransferase n=1 Tax=Cohnella faecalis TaxID=2315694 RepID=A0A398CHA7_9BACL|nr:sugar phosphate nucleotidyltransferase [Cohnella faecalis]RIE01855.1 nucleotidyl transferase [Cohnella faecalis]